MVKIICAQCGKEKDYDDFPILEKLNLVAGESICSICTEEERERDYLTPEDETTPENEKTTVDGLRKQIIDIEWLSIIIGVGIHMMIFCRLTKIYDDRSFDFMIYQIAIFGIQICLMALIVILRDIFYKKGMRTLSMIFTYIVLGIAIIPPIAFIIILNPK